MAFSSLNTYGTQPTTLEPTQVLILHTDLTLTLYPPAPLSELHTCVGAHPKVMAQMCVRAPDW